MTHFYDGLNVIIERDENNQTIATYTRGLSFGGGIGGIISIARRDEDGEGFETLCYHYDGLGSVRQLTGEQEIICVIATAVYGTPMASEVKVLSRLRDEHLLTNKWGQRLVAFYYRHSPSLVEFISDREWAKRVTRLALLPLVRITELIVKEADAVSTSNPNPSGSAHLQQFRMSVSIEAEYTYDAFGNILAIEYNIEGNNHDNPYGFTGEQQFREADNLIFLRARYYDPRVGRFISRDPILKPMVGGYGSFWPLPHLVGFPQMLHPYTYVHNNPVNWTDPTGLKISPARAIFCLFCVVSLTAYCYAKCWPERCEGFWKYLLCVDDCRQEGFGQMGGLIGRRCEEMCGPHPPYPYTIIPITGR